MTEGKAQDLVNGAALVVAAIYFYRKLIEPAVGGAAGASAGAGASPPAAGAPKTVAGAAAQLMGQGETASTGRFVIGWGFTFLTLSLMTPALPELAGAFAGLVALGSILGNGTQLAADLETQLNREPTAAQAPAASSPTVAVSYAPGAAPPPSAPIAPLMPTGPAKRKPRRKGPKYKLQSV